MSDEIVKYSNQFNNPFAAQVHCPFDLDLLMAIASITCGTKGHGRGGVYVPKVNG